jgi:hypothetical protein
MERVAQISNKIDNISSFSVIDDPDCDGLGVEIMSIFSKALSQARVGLIMAVNDIVPNEVR